MAWIPDSELGTHEARAALPDSYSRADCVFNISRSSLLVASLASGNWDALREALHDKLHQPFRASLIRGYNEVVQTAIEAGALGATLSGAGSTVLIWLHPTDGNAYEIQSAIENAAARSNASGQVHTLEVDTQGACIENQMV
jgi:homoserine kinase